MKEVCIHCEHTCHCSSGICTSFNKNKLGKDTKCSCNECNCRPSYWGAPTEYME